MSTDQILHGCETKFFNEEMMWISWNQAWFP